MDESLELFCKYVSDDNWNKISYILKYLSKDSRALLTRYMANLQASGHDESFIFLHILCDMKKYNKIMNELFNTNGIDIKYCTTLSNMSCKKVINVLGGFDKYELGLLSPLNICLLLNKELFNDTLPTILLKHTLDAINQRIKEYAKEEEITHLKQIDYELMQNKKIDVQSYFKVVTSIMNYLLINDKEHKYTIEEKKNLSLIIGMYFYEDNNKDFNLKSEYDKLFSKLLDKEKILDYLSINNTNNFGLNKYYDTRILYTYFQDELYTNDILIVLKFLYGEKNSNKTINDLCNYLGIDNDELYDALNKLETLKDESLSDEELDNRYLNSFKDKNVDIVKIYNTASSIYNYLDKFKDNEYRNNTNKRRILSILISLYLNNYKDIIYLENQGITLKSLLNSTIKNTELLSKDFKLDDIVDEKVIVYKLGTIYDYDKILSELLNTKDKDVLLLFIKMGKDINTINYNMFYKKMEKPKLSYSEQIELINNDKPLLDVNSYSNISNYGNTIMEGVNTTINEITQILNEDTLSVKLNEIKNDLSSIYEETLSRGNEEKKSFMSWFLEQNDIGGNKKEIVIHYDYIKSLEEKIINYLDEINKQIYIYDWIQKRNIAYSMKLKEYIDEAIMEKNLLESNKPILDKNDTSSILKNQYYKTQIDLLNQKILSLNTSYKTIIEHFMMVDTAIKIHNISTNTLRKVINDFIPLLSSDMLNNLGIDNDKENNNIVKSIVELIKYYLDNNLIDAKNILVDLEEIGLPQERINRIKDDLIEGLELYKRLVNVLAVKLNKDIIKQRKKIKK